MLVAVLRQRILELAIQGQLVPQRPEDGTAEELYQQIQKEKKKLIAAGKLKKEKPLPPISEDEIPFDIPDSWKWVRLGELLFKLTDGTHSTPKYCTRGVPFLSVKNISNGQIDFNETKFISEEEHRELCARCKPECGDILLSKVGTTGVPAIVDTEIEFSIFVSIALLKFSAQLLYRVYLYYLLRSPLVQCQAKQNTRGVGNKNWVLVAIANTIVALPPLAEQQRIVERVQALFAELDAIEQSQERVAAIETELNKRILERAIQGKLVPQRPEEGTAEELYQQIQKEKKKHIAAGKLKKEKPLPPISKDEIPFDIPHSWKWVRLGELGVFERGAGIKKSEVVKDGLPCVRYGQLYTTYKESFSDAVSYVPEELFAKCKQAKKGDILMALTGENKPDIALAVVYEGENPLAIGGDMTRFTPICVNSHYLMKVINSPHGIAQKVKTATGDIIVHTSNDKLAALLIPLPPLAEQERIVHKIIDLNANI